LLLDEPTASLDAGRRGELAEMVRNLGADGRTVIIATHDKAFAQSCSARILQIEGGTIAEACECVFD
jgi:ABC-type polar amino acid transport system ATPase subunit